MNTVFSENSIYLVALNASYLIFSIFLSTVLLFLFLKFSKTLGIRDISNNMVRWSSDAKPAMGGIVFFIIYLIGLVLTRFFYATPLTNNLKLMGIFFSMIVAFTIGLFDDAYNTKPFIKFFAQLLCSAILIITGTYIQLFQSEYLNYTLTVLWVVGMMNSINMLDNMDAITTIVTMFILIILLVCMFITGSFTSANFFLFVGLIGSLSSFLYFNWSPSKMYMGDTGSQFLGILLAVVGIVYFWNGVDYYGQDSHIKQTFMTVICFALPIIDTTTVTIKRLSKGKSPFIGGKDHTTHHLAYLGLSSSQVALVFAGISVISGLLIITMFFIHTWQIYHTIIYAIYFLGVFGTLFRIALMPPPDAKK